MSGEQAQVEEKAGHVPSSLDAGSSQHLSSSAQVSLHKICSIWSWNVAELLRGPRALASLPRVTKPETGELPASPVGLSATFWQST